MDKIAIHQFWIAKNIFTTRLPIRRSRSGSQSWSGGPGQGNLIHHFCSKLHFSTQETAVRHFLTHFFRRKNLPKMRATVRSGWPGRGLVLLLSAARRPLSLPRYHSRPPPARLISGPHNPTSPCLGGKRRPAPNASPATDAPSCTWAYPIPPPLPQGPLRPPDLLPPKSGLTERATRIT